MQGIYFINDLIHINDLSKEESFQLQEQSLLEFIDKHHMNVVKLNPYQLYNHYTVLHALFYDLKENGTHLDCLAFYSKEVIDDFSKTYPARWLLIKSYFDECLEVCG